MASRMLALQSSFFLFKRDRQMVELVSSAALAGVSQISIFAFETLFGSGLI